MLYNNLENQYYFTNIMFTISVDSLINECMMENRKAYSYEPNLQSNYDTQVSYWNSSEILIWVFHRDQNSRSNKINDWTELNRLESINRATIDSILEFGYPTIVTNGLIDLVNLDQFDSKYMDLLQEINCFHLMIRYFRKSSLVQISNLLEQLQGMFLKSVELALVLDVDVSEVNLAHLISKYVFIDAVICYNSCHERVSNLVDPAFQVLMFSRQIISLNCCGIVSPSYFALNSTAYLESIHHNSCLNRKISIDMDGNIKNCPSMSESFGNIQDTTLAEAIEKPGFKKYWDINKDKIHVCKDCEFRYVCTDCRAYVEDPDDILSKPLKCGYNPYTGVWEEWSTHPMKQKAIDYYGMRDMVDQMNTREGLD